MACAGWGYHTWFIFTAICRCHQGLWYCLHCSIFSSLVFVVVCTKGLGDTTYFIAFKTPSRVLVRTLFVCWVLLFPAMAGNMAPFLQMFHVIVSLLRYRHKNVRSMLITFSKRRIYRITSFTTGCRYSPSLPIIAYTDTYISLVKPLKSACFCSSLDIACPLHSKSLIKPHKGCEFSIISTSLTRGRPCSWLNFASTAPSLTFLDIFFNIDHTCAGHFDEGPHTLHIGSIGITRYARVKSPFWASIALIDVFVVSYSCSIVSTIVVSELAFALPANFHSAFPPSTTLMSLDHE